MLAARASSVRSASRIARSFATVVDTAGVRVAALDNGQPTSAVTVLVKAGSRFESKPGVAHALKNFAFKSTATRSTLGTVRESELYGGVLSSSLSREHLAVTAEFLRGDEAFFVDLLSTFVTSAKFTRHEFNEYVAPVVQAESTAASSDPATHAVDVAHALAFHNGLGASLFASPHSDLSHEDIKSFAAAAFTKSNFAFLGTGIDQSTLAALVEKSLGSRVTAPSSASAPPTTSTSSYFGGETRIEAHGGPQTVFIGFGATGAPAPALAALAAHLSPLPSVKWAQGLSPISAGVPVGTSVRAVYLPYSDATLFGLLVQGETSDGVREAGKVAVKALKDSAGPGGVGAEELKKAVAKAKFSTASAAEGREGLVSLLGTKILAGSQASLEGTLASFDKVTTAEFGKAGSALIKGKPTFVAIGNTQTLPYPDELGL